MQVEERDDASRRAADDVELLVAPDEVGQEVHHPFRLVGELRLLPEAPEMRQRLDDAPHPQKPPIMGSRPFICLSWARSVNPSSSGEHLPELVPCVRHRADPAVRSYEL